MSRCWWWTAVNRMLESRSSALSLRASASSAAARSVSPFNAVSGGEILVKDGMGRHRVARLFEPDDRLVGARLQQMHQSDGLVPDAELGIAGTEPNGSFYKRDRLID
jgi:hypothetical protein